MGFNIYILKHSFKLTELLIDIYFLPSPFKLSPNLRLDKVIDNMVQGNVEVKWSLHTWITYLVRLISFLRKT